MDNSPVDKNLAIWTLRLYQKAFLSLGDSASSLQTKVQPAETKIP